MCFRTIASFFTIFTAYNICTKDNSMGYPGAQCGTGVYMIETKKEGYNIPFKSR
jgi:hypothetical protein